MGLKIPFFNKKFKQDFDGQSVTTKAFELIKGMHEPIKIGDWVLQQHDGDWIKERAADSLDSSYHPCRIYLYRANRSK